MIAAVLCSLAVVGSTVGRTAGVRFDDVSLEFEEEILDHRFVDIDGDGQLELCLALRNDGGERELRFLRRGRLGFDPEPMHAIPVLEDVLAYGFADVRDEAGDELLFLTRSGAWSYSLQRSGYRGNIARLVDAELLYDVPDNSALPFWAYVMPHAGGDLVLLPGRDYFSIWGPCEASDETEEADPGAASYRSLRVFDVQRDAVDGGRNGESGTAIETQGDARVELRFAGAGGDVFLSASEASSSLLRDGKSYGAPAVVDLDGDGDRDMILRRGDSVLIYLAEEGVVPASPTRIEPFPDYLANDDLEIALEFVDLDLDGDLDLVGQLTANLEGFENVEIRVLALLNDGERLLPEQANQVLRFEGAYMRVDVAQVDDDGLPDLVIGKFELPSMLETVSGLEFDLTRMIFLSTGEAGRPFERKPALRSSQTFDENSVGDAVANRHLVLDCDGDGIPDLVEADLQGRIAIRRLLHEDGFFSGETWELEENPWKRFETRGSLDSLQVRDINGDGLADIISPGGNSLTLFVSARTR